MWKYQSGSWWKTLISETGTALTTGLAERFRGSSGGNLNAGGGRNNYGSTIELLPNGVSGGPSLPIRYFEDTQFFSVCNTISSNILQIRKHETALAETLKTIGNLDVSDTVKDSAHVVTKAALKTISETATQVNEITQLIQYPLPTGEPVSNDVKMRATKLKSDFERSVLRFNEVQKQILMKLKVIPLPTANTTAFTDESESRIPAIQSQLLRQQQLELERGLLLEREAQIRKIESDIVECNEIMRDLAELVNEQGEVIDRIDVHLQDAYSRVNHRTSELREAELYKRKRRSHRRMLCMGMTLFIMVIIIIMITVMSS